METAVRFKNARGQTLHGILHAPEGGVAPGGPGVVWLSAGQKSRLGAWRMNVHVARRLARMGVPTLRFDFHGIGDSEGEHPHGQFVMDLYGFIQTGGFRDDVVAASNFLLGETGVTRLVYGGLCGGAISGLFAAPLVKEVYGHVLVDLPVTISSAARQKFLEENPVELLRTDPLAAETVFMLYLRKATDLSAWRRLFAGQSDYRLLQEAMRHRARAGADRVGPYLPSAVRESLARWLKPVAPGAPTAAPGLFTATTGATMGGAAGGSPPGQTATGEVVNELVAPAFRAALAAGQRVRFLNSSTYHPTFMAYFGDQHLPKDPAAWKGFDLTVAPDTNHIFSLEHSQRALFGAIESMAREAAGGPRGMPRTVEPVASAAE